MSFNISIDVSLKSEHPKLIHGSEYEPFIFFYLTKELDPYGLYGGTLNLSQIKGKSVSINIKRDVDRYREYEKSIKASISKVYDHVKNSKSMVGVMLFCRRWIKVGDNPRAYHRYEPIGRTVIPLIDLLQLRNNKPMQYNIIDETDQHKNKFRAAIVIKVNEYKTSPQFAIDRDVVDILSYWSNIKDTFESWFDTYKDQYFNKMKSTNEKFELMHVPKWYSCHEIPSSFYLLYVPNEKPNLTFLNYVLNAALSALDLSPDWFKDTINRQLHDPQYENKFDYSINMCTKILATACTTFANACDYLSDISLVNDKGIEDDTERFINLCVTFAGDCEDGAHDAYVMWRMFMHAKLHPDINQHPLVLCASELAELYICGMNTCIACTRAFDDSVKDINTSELDGDTCHMIASCIPRIKFFNMLQKGNRNTEQMKAILRDVNTYKLLHEYGFEDKLNVIILEGTNWVNSLHMPLHLYLEPDVYPQDHIDVIENQKMLLGAKHLIEEKYPIMKTFACEVQQLNITSEDIYDIKKNDISPFYRDQNNFLTALDGSIPLDLSIQYCKTNRYSVDFRDYISGSNEICLYPFYELSIDEYNYGKHVVDLEPVIMPRILPPVDKVRSILISKSKPLSDLMTLSNQYKDKVQKLKKQSDYVNNNTYAFTYNVITYKVNHITKLFPQHVESIKSLLSNKRLNHKESNKSFSINGLEVNIYPLKFNELYYIDIKLYVSSP